MIFFATDQKGRRDEDGQKNMILQFLWDNFSRGDGVARLLILCVTILFQPVCEVFLMATKIITDWAAIQEILAGMRATPDKSNFKVIICSPFVEVELYGNMVALPRASRSYCSEQATDEVNSSGNDFDGEWLSMLGLDDDEEEAPPRYTPEQGRMLRASANEKHLRRLINRNFSPATAQFVTLTTRQRCDDFTVFRKWCSTFKRKLRRNVPGIKFVGVPGVHEDGAFHLHLLTDRTLPLNKAESEPYIRSGVIRSAKGSWQAMWCWGGVHSKPVDGGGNLGASISRYLKENASQLPASYAHTFYRSDNLAPYQEIRDTTGIEYVYKNIVADGLSPIYGYYCDAVDYIREFYHIEYCVDPEAALYYGRLPTAA